MSPDGDWQIRLAAMQKLNELRRQGGTLISSLQLYEGFAFECERISRQARHKRFLFAAV